MYKELIALIGEPIGTSKLSSKGHGTVTYYEIPDDKVEEVKKLLGVTINDNWADCVSSKSKYEPKAHLEVFRPEHGRPTAQLYAIPWDQTDKTYVYVSSEVVLD